MDLKTNRFQLLKILCKNELFRTYFSLLMLVINSSENQYVTTVGAGCLSRSNKVFICFTFLDGQMI